MNLSTDCLFQIQDFLGTSELEGIVPELNPWFYKNKWIEPRAVPDWQRYERLKGVKDPRDVHAGVKHLAYESNEPVELPAGLHTVEFGYEFNRRVELPAGVHTVEFGFCFNQPVELPAGVHTVKFGYYFNRHVKLPAGLHTVEFGHGFSQPVVLPAGLREIKFSQLICPRGSTSPIKRSIFLFKFKISLSSLVPRKSFLIIHRKHSFHIVVFFCLEYRVRAQTVTVEIPQH